MTTEQFKVEASNKHLTVALFDTQEQLIAALRELHRLGFTNDQISILARDQNAAEETARVEGATTGMPVDSVDSLAEVAEPKGRDESVGMAVGGAIGLVVGLSAIVIPGFGAFLLAAGPVAVAMHALTTSAAGIGLGALVGAILDEKVTEEHRNIYTAAIEQGKWLLAIHGQDEDMSRASEALREQSALRVETF